MRKQISDTSDKYDSATLNTNQVNLAHLYYKDEGML